MFKLLSICFVTYFTLTAALSYFDASTNSELSDTSVIQCILEIIKIDLDFRPTTVIVNDQRNEKDFLRHVIDGLTKNNIPLIIFEDMNDSDQIVYQSDLLIIKYLLDCERIVEFSENIITEDFKYLIIINKYISNHCVDKLQELGYKLGRIDVTFMVEDSSEFITAVPFIDSTTCQETVLQLTPINTCKNGLVKKTSVFPSKDPINLNKCPFNVGMGPLYPYSTIKNKEKLKNYDRLENITGSDLELIKIINNYFNGSLELFYIYKREESPLGDIDFLQFVLNGSLDACAGGIYRVYGDGVAYSGVYSKENANWVYYVERVKRSWQNLYDKVDGFYIFFIFYIFNCLIWFFITKFDKNAIFISDTLLYSWGALVGAASLQEARSLKQRIVIIMYLVMCIHFSAYTSIQLYSFLTISEPPETYRTNQDIISSGRPAFLNAPSKFFITDEGYVKYAETSEDCISLQDCSEKAFTNKGVTILLDAQLIRFQAMTAVNDEARMLKAFENIVFVYHEMIIRKDSPLVLRFGKVLQRLFESGITEKLYFEAIGLSVVSKAAVANKNMISDSYNCQLGCQISLSEIAGGFYVWVFGCCLSCFVFVLELVVKRA